MEMVFGRIVSYMTVKSLLGFKSNENRRWRPSQDKYLTLERFGKNEEKNVSPKLEA